MLNSTLLKHKQSESKRKATAEQNRYEDDGTGTYQLKEWKKSSVVNANCNGTNKHFDCSSAKTPSLFSLVNAILFHQKMKSWKRSGQKKSEAIVAGENNGMAGTWTPGEASLTEGQKKLVRRKISISLKHTQSLPLNALRQQKTSLSPKTPPTTTVNSPTDARDPLLMRGTNAAGSVKFEDIDNKNLFKNIHE